MLMWRCASQVLLLEKQLDGTFRLGGNVTSTAYQRTYRTALVFSVCARPRGGVAVVCVCMPPPPPPPRARVVCVNVSRVVCVVCVWVCACVCVWYADKCIVGRLSNVSVECTTLRV